MLVLPRQVGCEFLLTMNGFSCNRYDLLDVSINVPKEKLNSTVVSQVSKTFTF